MIAGPGCLPRYRDAADRPVPLVDRVDDHRGIVHARLPWQADDIDGVTQLDEALPPGTIAEVAVEEVVDDYDFQASVIRVAIPAGAPHPRRVSRQLPINQTTIGSYGKAVGILRKAGIVHRN